MNGKRNFQWQDAALPIFAAVSVLALLFRLPYGLMDLALSVNLAISATIFLATFFISKPLEFSAFPTILLTTTLYRLVLNVSTTRLILTQGNAGQVVDAFSRFVAGDSVVVGAVVFLIFVIIQFVVITKGATRISEVTARFTLDALPGRQSAIDFDLNAGNITEEEAKAARAELSEQSDFFGAMDGASKFVRGDAIAGLAIVLVNLIGGLCIGVFQRHMSIGDAVSLYSKLTIGDGLVSQLPAFLISIATGLLVARTSRSQNVSSVALSQTFGRPIALATTGVFLLFLAFTGLPFLPLSTLAAGFLVLAWFMARRSKSAVALETVGGGSSTAFSASAKREAEEDDAELDRALKVEPLEIAIGAGLAGVAIPKDGPTLLDRVKRVRLALASELGVVLPKTRVRDDKSLDENRFSIRVNGVEVATGVVYPQSTLAVDSGYATSDLKGLSATGPGGARAFWIDSADEESAIDDGYELMSPGDLIERRTLEVARREAATFLSRDATKRLVERLRETNPALVEEALGDGGDGLEPRKLARIQQVLRLLLAEGVSIFRLDVILEAVDDLALRDPDADAWQALEFARRRLARIVVEPYRDEDGVLPAAFLDPDGEDALRETLEKSENGEPSFALSSERRASLAAALRSASESMREFDLPATALVDRDLRYALRGFATSIGLDLTVLAFDELDSATRARQEVVVDWRGA